MCTLRKCTGGEYSAKMPIDRKPALNKNGGFAYSCLSESSLYEPPSRLLRIDAERTAGLAKHRR